MGDYLIEAGIVAAVYGIARWVEAKFIRKTNSQGRKIIKDSVVVCISAVVALWGAGQFGMGEARVAPTQAFVGKPEF
tara:strand:+ start:394 stop:624 length:231 start_codon:yes stop_codon:yes gene_type:complete